MTKAENTAAAPAESTAPAAEPAVQPEAVPTDPMAGDASEIENENSFPHFLTETEALAAETRWPLLKRPPSCPKRRRPPP